LRFRNGWRGRAEAANDQRPDHGAPRTRRSRTMTVSVRMINMRRRLGIPIPMVRVEELPESRTRYLR
jgi:hypothetical protein